MDIDIKRQLAGWTLVALGGFVVMYTALHSKTLPQAIYTRTVEKEVTRYKDGPAPSVDPPGTVLWDTTRVQNRWESTQTANKGAPVGQYQLKDDEGNISVIKFCNDPPPDFEVGSYIKLKANWDDNRECSWLQWAQVVKEAPAKK